MWRLNGLLQHPVHRTDLLNARLPLYRTTLPSPIVDFRFHIMITRINGALYAPWLAFPFPREVVGVPVPLPPPAPLLVPDEYKRAIGETLFRCDDRGQGLLF